MGSTRRDRLAARVADVLADTGEPEPAVLDELLTDCAAEALSIRAGILERQRRLERLLAGGLETAAAREEASTLAARNQGAWEDWRALSELIGELRTRRDSQAAHGPVQRPGAN